MIAKTVPAVTSCGIEIAARRAIFVFLRREGGQVVDVTGRQTQIKIENADDPGEIRLFCQKAHALLDDKYPARIAIVQRKKRGHFASGGTTFKLEGLLQLYKPNDIAIVAPALLRKYAKEARPLIRPRYGYQKNAYLLAHYLIRPAGGERAKDDQSEAVAL
ncbi:MAG: DUF3010 family protein [Desulfobacterales bacterium]|jgi:hypothetical protein